MPLRRNFQIYLRLIRDLSANYLRVNYIEFTQKVHKIYVELITNSFSMLAAVKHEVLSKQTDLTYMFFKMARVFARVVGQPVF